MRSFSLIIIRHFLVTSEIIVMFTITASYFAYFLSFHKWTSWQTHDNFIIKWTRNKNDTSTKMWLLYVIKMNIVYILVKV